MKRNFATYVSIDRRGEIEEQLTFIDLYFIMLLN